MKRIMVVLGAMVFCFAVNGVFAADVFTGNWKLNLAKSTYDPGPPPKGPVFTKIEAIPGGLKFTIDGVNAQGKPTHSEWSGKFDGKDNPVEGTPTRDTAAMTKIDDYTLETVNKKDGNVTSVIRGEHSRDGKTRTLTYTGTNPRGVEFKNVTVWEKL